MAGGGGTDTRACRLSATPVLWGDTLLPGALGHKGIALSVSLGGKAAVPGLVDAPAGQNVTSDRSATLGGAIGTKGHSKRYVLNKPLLIFQRFVGRRGPYHQRTLSPREGKVQKSPNFTPPRKGHETA